MTYKHLWVLGLLVLGIAGIPSLVEADNNTVMGLYVLWIAAVLWMSEIIPVTITALCVPVLGVLLGITDAPEALVQFANPIIFLFLGGFALAAAMREQGLDSYLAHYIIKLTGGNLLASITTLCLASALLSMWISNTATAALMLPLVIGLLKDGGHVSKSTLTFSLLGIAFSCSIGGIGSLVGSPPNAIVAAQLNLSFYDWLTLGLPVSAVLLPFMLGLLYWYFKPQFGHRHSALDEPQFNWTSQRILLMLIFSFVVTGWLFSKPIGAALEISKSTDSVIAIIGIILLCASRVTTWKNIQDNTDWGVLLLFGGGLTLSTLLKTSGASLYLGDALATLVTPWPTLLVLFTLVVFVIFLTELTSNTATTALLVPIFVTLPSDLVSSTQAALAIGFAASCAFMLPVATPPNAIVYGTGKIELGDMLKIGLRLNLAIALVLAGILYVFF